MADVVTSEKRSQMMAGIRSKNTKPELIIRKKLFAAGFRYRLHEKLPGRPDIVLRKYNAVIFINGCFWHGHKCSLFVLPKTRTEFWKNKIAGNSNNDLKCTGKLLELGWRIATIWECSLKGKDKWNIDDLVKILTRWIESDIKVLELKFKK